VASFFFHSNDGDSLPVVQRLIREGHTARMYIANKESKKVGEGLVPKATSLSPKKGDIIVFDMTGYGKVADLMRKQGYQVIGGSHLADQLERDRGFAMTVMRNADIPVPETVEFRDLRDADRFLSKRNPAEGWYIKPFGENDCSDTYGAKDVAEMVRWFDSIREAGLVPKRFLLQKKMKDSSALSFEGWFDGDKWVLPWNSTIEDKKLFVGDVGPNTGWMANLVWAYEQKMPKLAMKTLARLASLLRGRYCGPIDINVIFDEKGEPHGLEFTPRFGYGAIQALMLLVGGDFGAQLAGFAAGRLHSFQVATDQYSLAINVSTPPFPSEASEAAGRRIDPRILYDPIRIMPADIMVIEGMPTITGRDAGVAAFGDVWHDLDELRSMVLGRIKDYAIPMAQYRTDPVKRAESVFAHLGKYDYEVPTPRPEEYRTVRPEEAVEISPEREGRFDIDRNSPAAFEEAASARGGANPPTSGSSPGTGAGFGDSPSLDIPTFGR
jgi:phosphoribosylamine--glycine ligase